METIKTIEENYVEHVERSIALAKKHVSRLSKFQLEIDGMSSYKNRHLFNNLCAPCQPDIFRYLEIGSWKGSTFCAAIFNNDVDATSIENFSEFIDTSFKGERVHPKFAFKRNLDDTLINSISTPKITLIEKDSFSVDVNSLGKFDIYFYDGEHSFDNHVKAFTYFNPCLKDVFITVVDDYQQTPGHPVYEATKKAFADLKYNVVKDWYLYEPTGSTVQGAMDGWWNGLYIAVVRKNV